MIGEIPVKVDKRATLGASAFNAVSILY